jgi:hypothetical protein
VEVSTVRPDSQETDSETDATADDRTGDPARERSPVPRRTYLAAVGATIGGVSLFTTAGDSRGQSTETASNCRNEAEMVLAQKRDRLEAHRSELASVREEANALVEEISALRTEKRVRRTGAPEPIRERARAVGVAAREHLVSVDLAESDLLGWCFGERSVLTHTLVLDHRETEPGTAAEATLPDGETVSCELVDRTDETAPGLALWRTDTDVPAAPLGDASTLEPGDELVAVTDVPDRDRVITLGELVRRIDDSPASLASTVPVYGAHGGVVSTLQGEVVGSIYGSGPRRVPDLPEYLDQPVQMEALPWLSESRHVPVETVRETVEGWT